ncbi:MAG: hypothetical protein IJ833_01540 [Lachnospiraceae bacterium]|nr:hypothetical protein [Lachnospiraceae bacterium]
MDSIQRDHKSGTTSAEGFLFFSAKDAALAKTEQKKVDYLEARMDYSKPETILRVYQKAIEERIFKTPVGIVYLKKLQDYLLKEGQMKAEQVPPIALYQYYDNEVRPQPEPARKRIQPAPVRQEKQNVALPISIILNILLVIAILAMFVISFSAEQPNIFNYERALTDRYSSWEQELQEREQVVREKELELHISE